MPGDSFELLGYGPAATGSEYGWRMRADLYAKCPRCSEMLTLDPAKSAGCSCGSLWLDAEAGRFGSSMGDAAIEIYGLR